MKKSRKYFIAAVDGDRLEDIESIAGRLKALGCEIHSILSLSGIISGSTGSDLPLDDLKVDGIRNIEPDRKIGAVSK